MNGIDNFLDNVHVDSDVIHMIGSTLWWLLGQVLSHIDIFFDLSHILPGLLWPSLAGQQRLFE